MEQRWAKPFLHRGSRAEPGHSGDGGRGAERRQRRLPHPCCTPDEEVAQGAVQHTAGPAEDWALRQRRLLRESDFGGDLRAEDARHQRQWPGAAGQREAAAGRVVARARAPGRGQPPSRSSIHTPHLRWRPRCRFRAETSEARPASDVDRSLSAATDRLEEWAHSSVRRPMTAVLLRPVIGMAISSPIV
jgi:hypothetical protein